MDSVVSTAGKSTNNEQGIRKDKNVGSISSSTSSFVLVVL